MEKWIKAIPMGSHGSGDLQKRLWKLVSDYVRIRDFYQYGTCIATGKKIAHWKDGDAGHFISYSKCNGLFKFDERNIHLQSKRSNGFGDRDDWKQYETELGMRYGDGHVSLLEDENSFHQKHLKFSTEQIIEKMEDILNLLDVLPEQPDYFTRVLELYEKENSA